MCKNYKCSTSKLQEFISKLKEAEEHLICAEQRFLKRTKDLNDLNENECLIKCVETKTAENAKLCTRLLLMRVIISKYCRFYLLI